MYISVPVLILIGYILWTWHAEANDKITPREIIFTPIFDFAVWARKAWITLAIFAAAFVSLILMAGADAWTAAVFAAASAVAYMWIRDVRSVRR